MAKKKFRRRFRRRARVYNTRYPAVVKSQSVASGTSIDRTLAKAQGMYQDYLGAYNKYKPIAVQAYNAGMKALELLNAEKKYFDVAATTITPAGTAGAYSVISLLNNITIGDGPTNRDGSQIRLKSVNLQLSFQINAAATLTQLRWVLFRDTRVQIGASPVWTDLYDSTSLINTFVNIADQMKRFRIIRQGTVILSSTQNPYQTSDIWVPCSLPIRYDTANEVINNALYLMIASSEATNTPTVVYRYRVRFYDN